tara:strand:- start:1019 stop:1432 length:414 start_codon:yes stop_codon:yes gene_type:complete
VEKIHSKLDSNLLLAIVNRKNDCDRKRIDLCPQEELLQVSVKNLNPTVEFVPHKHKDLERRTYTTQEAWVIISGKIKAEIWDTNDLLVYETELRSGDCLVALRGGHCFKVLEENTILYEFKNGPYYGVDKDKSDIER